MKRAILFLLASLFAAQAFADTPVYLNRYAFGNERTKFTVLGDGTTILTSSAISGGVNAQTGTTYTFLASDDDKLVTFSNGSAVAVTLPVATTTGFVSGFYTCATNLGVGTVTITPTTSTIDARATAVLKTGQSICIWSNGTNYFSNAAGTTTGSGNTVLATSPALVTPDLGTPSAATLTSATGLPVSTGISGLGTGVATFLATPSSANFASAITDETGTGSVVLSASPVFTGLPSMPAYKSTGTTFALSGACTTANATGGSSAGTFTTTTTGACAVTITMGGGATAPTGWACEPNNRTTGNIFRQTASTTTTANFLGTTVSGDTLSFACIGY